MPHLVVRTVLAVVVAVVGLSAVSSARTAEDAVSVVYVSAAPAKEILVYHRDPDSGQLVRRAAVKLSGEPGALTTTPDRRYLLAAYRSTGQLASFSIERATGGLKLINVVEAGPDPAHITTDPTGKYLLAAYYVAGKVSVHAIGADGRLSEQPRQEITTADKAHAIRFDPSGRYVFAPHTGTNRIEQFVWDAALGRLLRNAVGRIDLPANTGPRHLDWQVARNIAIVDNEQASSVTSYRLDPQRGTLRAIQTLSTLPADFRATNSCAEVKVHPSGKFAYAANRGHDSLAGFALGNDGELRALGQFATERTPRSFDISPDGRHLIAAGESSGALQVYDVDAQSGRLTPTHRYEVAPGLWWVLAVQLSETTR